jgi:predicted nucleotidyltransferase
MNETKSIRGIEGIQVGEIQEPSDLDMFIEYARENGTVTVVLDHVTEFCNLVLAKIMKLEKLPEQLSWGLAKQQDYQQMGLQTKEYLRGLFDLDCNVIVLGQQRSYDATEDGEGNLLMPYVSVAATPAVAGWLAPACDYVVQTFKRKVEVVTEKKLGTKTIKTKSKSDKVQYLLRTGPSEIYNTKFRLPVGEELPEYIVDPSYSKIKHLL